MSEVHEERPLWEQALGEPALWYGRFTEWLHQAPPRSLLALYKGERARKGATRSDKTPLQRIKTSPASWAKAREEYQWRVRAEAWDRTEQSRKDAEWAVTREAERHQELALAEALRKIARALLNLPVLREEIKRDHKGEPIAFLLIPEFRAFKTASDMLGQAKNHARAALEMPNKFDRNEVTGKARGPVEVDANVRLTEEERLERLLDITRQVTATHSNTEEGEYGPSQPPP